LQPIYILGLRRSFVVSAEWAGSPLEALRTQPRIPDSDHPVEQIAVSRRSAFYEVRLPSGYSMQGSLAELTSRLDQIILRSSLQDEGDVLALPAAVLSSPDGTRVAFCGESGSGKSRLAMRLIDDGWNFEGDAVALARPNGIVPLPRPIRVRRPERGLPAGGPAEAPLTMGSGAYARLSINPLDLMETWVIRVAPIHALVLLEWNPGGLTSLRPLSSDDAFGRSLRLSWGEMTATAAGTLRRHINRSRAWTLRIGSLDEATARLAEALDPCGVDRQAGST
jgi:hypothetical protein